MATKIEKPEICKKEKDSCYKTCELINKCLYREDMLLLKGKPKTAKAIKEKLLFLQSVEQVKVGDQAYHINRFTKEQQTKIKQDYYWLKGATEAIEWVLGKRESI